MPADTVTADEKYLEEFAKARTQSRKSKLKFLKEAPTQDDWTTWVQFWKQHTVGKLELITPLGERIRPTHRVCDW